VRDTYGPREFVRAGRIPEALILQNPGFEAAMQGLAVAGGVYTTDGEAMKAQNVGFDVAMRSSWRWSRWIRCCAPT